MNVGKTWHSTYAIVVLHMVQMLASRFKATSSLSCPTNQNKIFELAMLLLLAVLVLVVCILKVLTTTVDVEDKVKKSLATSLTAVNQEEEL